MVLHGNWLQCPGEGKKRSQTEVADAPGGECLGSDSAGSPSMIEAEHKRLHGAGTA